MSEAHDDVDNLVINGDAESSKTDPTTTATVVIAATLASSRIGVKVAESEQDKMSKQCGATCSRACIVYGQTNSTTECMHACMHACVYECMYMHTYVSL